jgi:hypothetical protein
MKLPSYYVSTDNCHFFYQCDRQRRHRRRALHAPGLGILDPQPRRGSPDRLSPTRCTKGRKSDRRRRKREEGELDRDWRVDIGPAGKGDAEPGGEGDQVESDKVETMNREP